jgi:WhiB family transcriptional regulator, redox-sensing transcriptional regulator
MTEQRWRFKAACADRDTNFWFPAETGVTPAMRRAVEICRGCEVIAECLDHAMTKPEYHGIWGGLTAPQRHDLRRRPVRTPREAS